MHLGHVDLTFSSESRYARQAMPRIKLYATHTMLGVLARADELSHPFPHSSTIIRYPRN